MSPALKLYVCNVTTQRGETDGFGVVEHLEALERHAGGEFVDCVLANDNLEPTRALEAIGVRGVTLEGLDRVRERVRVVLRDLVNPEQPWRHDPAKLAEAVLDIARTMKRDALAVQRKPSDWPMSARSMVQQPLGAGRGE